MLTVNIIGSGNVAEQLAIAFQKTDKVNASHIYSTNQSTGKALAKNVNAQFVEKIDELPTQLTILCVPDDKISGILNEIPDNFPVVYTSGSVDLNQLPKRKDLGVFYPLQTFSKGRKINLFEVPIFIESNNDYFSSTIFDLAWSISRKVEYADSEKRKKLHLCAVFINNFSNHIIYIAEELSKKFNIDFEHFSPLLHETIAKLSVYTAFDAQTGPARRNDKKTIKEHLKMLEDDNYKSIYKTLTESILKTYHHDKL